MGLIDLILNLAGVLLWLSWRSIRFDPLRKATAATLVGTLRRAEPRRLKGWEFLAGLAALLLLRALLYRHIGSTVDWTPKLSLFFVVLAFPSESFHIALLFSVLSFARVLAVCYIWALVLVIINGSIGETDPLQKMLRLHLGPIARWPRLLQLLLPPLLIVAAWAALHPLLVHWGIMNPLQSSAHLVEQGLLIGVALGLTLQYLLPVFLLLHLVSSYVFLGKSVAWDFVGATARNLLVPIRWLPLRLGRLDFAPLVGVILMLLLLHWLPDLILGRLAENNVSPWPE
jgi:uncharacterized protein YggT (Ycf19 family)